MNKLTPRQETILNYIQQKVSEKGYPPSVREIGEAVGLASSSTVHGHLERLEKKGYIRRDPTKPRTIEILKSDNARLISQETVMIPIVGKVTAGAPITAVENIEEYYPVPQKQLEGDKTYFILKIVGDSMVNAGILDGDYALIKKQPTAHEGEIVVAMTPEGEATVKRIYREHNYIRLQPENDLYQPILISEVTILGKVMSLIRSVVH